MRIPPIYSILLGTVTVDSETQLSNMPSSSRVTPLGMLIFNNERHLPNADPPRLVILLGIVIFNNEL